MYAGDHVDMSIFSRGKVGVKCSYCRRKIKDKHLTQIQMGTDEGVITLNYHTACIQPVIDSAEIRDDVD